MMSNTPEMRMYIHPVFPEVEAAGFLRLAWAFDNY
jgi:hypothetical protein